MDKIIYPAPTKPMSVARHLTAHVFTVGSAPTLRNWLGEWFIYIGKSWAPVNELTVKGAIWQRLEEVHYITEKDGAVEYNPTTAKVSNLMEPLAVMNSVLIRHKMRYVALKPLRRYREPKKNGRIRSHRHGRRNAELPDRRIHRRT